MKVLINGLIIDRKKAGIGQYSYNVVQGLAKREDFDYTFLLQNFIDISAKNVWYKKEFQKSRHRIFFEQFVLPFQSNKFDLIHYLDYSSPVIKNNKPFVQTIHDLSFYRYPEAFSTGSRKIKQFLAPKGIRRAARIITDSENTKNDIIEYFPEAKDKIRVVYPAVSGFYSVNEVDAIEEIKGKYKITGNYVLGVGTIEPRKNLIRLIKAFKEVQEEFKDINLVLVGKKGWLYDDIMDELDSEELRKRIIYTGYVDQEDMKFLYSGAKCFVYPSIYEGFGLPPLEAMSCGTPVVVSHTSSLPEVVGSAGLYVNPTDVGNIAGAIKRLLGDEGLRKELAIKGLAQAKQFNWTNAIESIVNVYREILE